MTKNVGRNERSSKNLSQEGRDTENQEQELPTVTDCKGADNY